METLEFVDELLKRIRLHQDIKVTTFNARKQTAMKLDSFDTSCLSSSLLIGKTVEEFGMAIEEKRGASKRGQLSAAAADIDAHKYPLFKKPTLATRLVDIFKGKELPQFKGSDLETLLTRVDIFKDEGFSKGEYEFTKDLPAVQRYLCRALMYMEEHTNKQDSPLVPILATVILTRNIKSQDSIKIERANAAIDQLESILEPYILIFIKRDMTGSKYASRTAIVEKAIKLVQDIYDANELRSGEHKNAAAYLHDLALHSKLFGSQFRDSLAAASFEIRSGNQLRYVSDKGRLSLVFEGLTNSGSGEVAPLPDDMVEKFGEEGARIWQIIKTNVENGNNGKAVWDALKAYSDAAEGTDNERALKVAVYGIMLTRFSGLVFANPEEADKLLESLADVYGEVKDSKDMTEKKFEKIVDSVIGETTAKFVEAKEKFEAVKSDIVSEVDKLSLSYILKGLEGLTESVVEEEPADITTDTPAVTDSSASTKVLTGPKNKRRAVFAYIKKLTQPGKVKINPEEKTDSRGRVKLVREKALRIADDIYSKAKRSTKQAKKHPTVITRGTQYVLKTPKEFQSSEAPVAFDASYRLPAARVAELRKAVDLIDAVGIKRPGLIHATQPTNETKAKRTNKDPLVQSSMAQWLKFHLDQIDEKFADGMTKEEKQKEVEDLAWNTIVRVLGLDSKQQTKSKSPAPTEPETPTYSLALPKDNSEAE